MTNDRDNETKGHVVLIARHYPPLVSGGTRRASLLSAGLRRRGWRVSVASPVAPPDEPDWIPSPHPAALRAEAAMSRQSTRRTRVVTRVANAIRRLVYWPDGDMKWALQTARAIERVTGGERRPDWIISSSPPESTHLAASAIKRRTGIRWLAELRDSWVDEPLREELRRSRVRRMIERRIARTLLAQADQIVCVSDAIAREVDAFGIARPISVVEHFAEPSLATRTLEGTEPHLVHTGQFTLSHPQRTLAPVLDEFHGLLTTHPTATLHLVGRLTHEEIELAQRHPAGSHTRLYGPMPYAEARAFQRAATALILYQPETAALPGKLSEYLVCSAPILTVGAGRWLSRMEQIPHWPLAQLSTALAARTREPVDLYGAAIDRYDAFLTDKR